VFTSVYYHKPFILVVPGRQHLRSACCGQLDVPRFLANNIRRTFVSAAPAAPDSLCYYSGF